MKRARVGWIAAGEARKRRRPIDEARSQRKHHELRGIVPDVDDQSLGAGGRLDVLGRLRGLHRRQLEIGDVGRELLERLAGPVVGPASAPGRSRLRVRCVFTSTAAPDLVTRTVTAPHAPLVIDWAMSRSRVGWFEAA